MKLTPSDAQLFYRLWLPLLDYVNEVYRVNPAMIDMAHRTGLDLEAVRAIATRLWDNPEIIDQYLSHNTQLPAEHRSIVESWKRRVRGNFFLERHQSQGSIFIDSQTNMVYLVSGITSAWSESFPRETLPVFLGTTLIPFENRIIYDSTAQRYPIPLGPEIAQRLLRAYQQAKDTGTLCKTL